MVASTIKTICLLIAVISALFSFAQSKTAIIKQIKSEYQNINSSKTLKKIKLENEEFLDHVPDGGGELTVFFKKDSLVKIVEWIGISYGISVTEYYLKNDKPFFIYTNFQSFVKGDSLDYNNPKTTFEGRFYFKDGKLIDKKIRGDASQQTSFKDLLEIAKQNMEVLLKNKNKLLK